MATTRQANTADIPAISTLLSRAFNNDPCLNWVQQLKAPLPPLTASPTNDSILRRDLVTALLRSVLLVGVVEVVVVPVEGKDEEKIVAAALWLPPGQRVGPSTPITLARSGFIPVIIRAGWTGFHRTCFQFQEQSHASADKASKARGFKSSDAGWYLQLIGTDPAEEGKGYTSMLLNTSITSKPATPKYLEATSPKSRDIYKHKGYELIEEIRFGKGKVGADGIAQPAKDAIGVPIFVMAKWD